MLFSTYGEVIQVRMRATMQLRGQAFVVFKDQASADQALNELQDLNIFGSQIVSVTIRDIACSLYTTDSQLV